MEEKERAVPQAEAKAADIPTTAVNHRGNSAGVLVIQWLSYSFWWMFGISMVWLMAVVANFFVAGDRAMQWGEELAFPLAWVIVMLGVALASDLLYARWEPRHKTAASKALMLIYTVIFVLSAISSAIAVVVSLVLMLVNSDPIDTADGPKVALITSLLSAGIYALLAARALFGGRIAHLRKITWIVLSVLAVIFLICAVAGPAAKANSTKDDRLIEETLPDLAQNITAYAKKEKKLPADLKDVPITTGNGSTTQRLQALVSRGLVTYKPDAQSYGGYSETVTEDNTTSSDASNQYENMKYQLCANYKYEKKPNYVSDDTASTGSSTRYRVDTSTHGKGNVCYDLTVDKYYVSY